MDARDAAGGGLGQWVFAVDRRITARDFAPRQFRKAVYEIKVSSRHYVHYICNSTFRVKEACFSSMQFSGSTRSHRNNPEEGWIDCPYLPGNVGC